jgi:isoquinoline 1-oxidoreductase beta subunit
MAKSKAKKWTRRAFILTGGLVGGGMVVGGLGVMYMSNAIKKYSAKGFGEGDTLNAFVHISPDNKVTVAVARAEMGQGVTTSLPMLIAEELEVDINDIHIMSPQAESPYANTALTGGKSRDVYGGYTFMEKIVSFLPLVATGGSTSIVDAYDHLRMVGATAREQLITAAAQKWGVDKSKLYAEKSHIINRDSGEKLTYGELSVAASKIKVDLPKLKELKDFKVIGTSVKRRDIPEKVNGTAEFGLDVRMENMRYAAIKHASFHDGKITSINNEEEILAMPGVEKVILLPAGVGAVVVANNTWRAMNATKRLDFSEEGDSTLSTESISVMAEEVIKNDEMIATPEEKGDVAAVFSKSENVIDVMYEVPYLAHACMEPINCTALLSEGKLEVWIGSQGQSVVLDAANRSTGIDKENITTNMKYLGGGFGRRGEGDMVVHSTYVAQQMEGIPVQLVYSREESMRHEMYRPYVKSQFKVAVGEGGEIEAWENKIALQSLMRSTMMRISPMLALPAKNDFLSSEGAIHLPYNFKNSKVSFGQLDLPIQVGSWRSVGNSQNGFFTESVIDECAHAAGKDPYLFRKSKLKGLPRFEAVLDKVAEMSNWNSPLPEGKFRGIALHKSFGSIVAQVAEITKVSEKEFSIDNYYCVIDCGRTVNPDTIEAQMQSGIMYGISAAMYGEITFAEGEVEQYNFPQYEVVRMTTAPKVTTHIMNVDAYPGGVGEPGTPPAAPALANAIFAATGERVRSLPLVKSGFSFV